MELWLGSYRTLEYSQNGSTFNTFLSKKSICVSGLVEAMTAHGQANISYVANIVKRTIPKFHSPSDYREGELNSSSQHKYTDIATDTARQPATWRQLATHHTAKMQCDKLCCIGLITESLE